MAQVEIVSEREEPSGWRFVAQVLDDRGTLSRHEVRLGWADYNLWSASGADEPAAVAIAVLAFLLSRTSPPDLRPSFDASIARRLHSDADAVLPRFIRHAGSGSVRE